LNPLPTLLSYALVAYTIELDNEFEQRTPHRTTEHGATDPKGPWLTSMAMWFNCMQYLDEPLTVTELERRARTFTNLRGMTRWGYIKIDDAGVVQATAKGRAARAVWAALFAEIEQRWDERFGREAVDELRDALRSLIREFSVQLPDCLPILGYGLKSSHKRYEPVDENLDALPLAALLAKVLFAFTYQFERQTNISLAIAANVLFIIGRGRVRVRDLPASSFVSKEAIAVALGFLQRRGYAALVPDPDGKPWKHVELTETGRVVEHACRVELAALEERWRKHFGAQTVDRLREALQRIVGSSSIDERLLSGLVAPAGGWRAERPALTGLPRQPMVLHRGGWPDGS
jgi:DNA-binding MarR family transcriptional regulator